MTQYMINLVVNKNQNIYIYIYQVLPSDLFGRLKSDLFRGENATSIWGIKRSRLEEAGRLDFQDFRQWIVFCCAFDCVCFFFLPGYDVFCLSTRFFSVHVLAEHVCFLYLDCGHVRWQCPGSLT